MYFVICLFPYATRYLLKNFKIAQANCPLFAQHGSCLPLNLLHCNQNKQKQNAVVTCIYF